MMHKKLKPYLEGQLDKEQEDAMRRWLALHADEEDVEAALLDRYDTLYTKCLGREARERRRRRLFAAAAVLLALAAFPLGLMTGKKRSQAAADVQWRDIRVSAAERRKVTLCDGSTLVLGAGSRLTYPESFTSGVRHVFFEGEMLADITPDAKHPFVIKSNDVEVEVHGTAFGFKAYDDTRLVELKLFRGSLDMHFCRDGAFHSVSATPGDIVHWDRSEGQVSLTRGSRAELEAAAAEDVQCFLNIPLADIASDLGRKFGTSVVVTNPSLASKRFFGIFSNGEGLDDILHSLDPLGNEISITRSGDGYILN